MPQETFNCPACGGPNQPEAGMSRMGCPYCGANLVIPDRLRIKAVPRASQAERISAPLESIQIPEIDASDVLRQAQPVLIRAWNLYASWTWLRWILPACLTVFVIGILICIVLGIIPVIWISNQ